MKSTIRLYLAVFRQCMGPSSSFTLLSMARHHPAYIALHIAMGVCRVLVSEGRWNLGIPQPFVVKDKAWRRHEYQVVHCWGLLWVSKSVNWIFEVKVSLSSVLYVITRATLIVFLILCCFVFWLSCQYLPSDWLERPSDETSSEFRLPQRPGWRVCSIYCLLCPCPYKTYWYETTRTWYSIYFAENAIKHQPAGQSTIDLCSRWTICGFWCKCWLHKNALQIQLALIQSNLADL